MTNKEEKRYQELSTPYRIAMWLRWEKEVKNEKRN